jgi:hypothetical protein
MLEDKDMRDDPLASYYGRVNITEEVRLAAAKLGVHPLVYAKSLDELLANNEALSKLIETPELERRLKGLENHPTMTSTLMNLKYNKFQERIRHLEARLAYESHFRPFETPVIDAAINLYEVDQHEFEDSREWCQASEQLLAAVKTLIAARKKAEPANRI